MCVSYITRFNYICVCVYALKYVLQIFLKMTNFIILPLFLSTVHFPSFSHHISHYGRSKPLQVFWIYHCCHSLSLESLLCSFFSHVQLCVLFQESSLNLCQLVEASSMPNLNLVSLTYSSSAPFLSPLGTGTAFRINVFIMAILLSTSYWECLNQSRCCLLSERGRSC